MTDKVKNSRKISEKLRSLRQIKSVYPRDRIKTAEKMEKSN